MNLEVENKLLKQKISQLIQDNLELSEKLEYDYNPDKEVRKLTLQEKLELNMGNYLKKYRFSVQQLKQIYFTIMTSDPEPEFIDVTFDNNRMFNAFYKVDLNKEKQEIEKGELVAIDINKIPEDMPQLQQSYDIQNVIEKIMESKNDKSY